MTQIYGIGGNASVPQDGPTLRNAEKIQQSNVFANQSTDTKGDTATFNLAYGNVLSAQLGAYVRAMGYNIDAFTPAQKGNINNTVAKLDNLGQNDKEFLQAMG